MDNRRPEAIREMIEAKKAAAARGRRLVLAISAVLVVALATVLAVVIRSS